MAQRIDFQTDPGRYRHWKLKFDGEVAELLMEPALLTAAQANLAAVMFRFVVILTELIWLGVGLALYARRWRSQASSRPSETRKPQE